MMKQKQQQQQQAASKPAAATAAAPAPDGLDLQEAAAVVVGEGENGDGDGGKSPPHYVQELYRRYRERVAADLGSRKQRQEEEEEVDGRGGGRGMGEEGGWKEESEGDPSRGGGGGGSLAFVDSVVGQLRVRESCLISSLPGSTLQLWWCFLWNPLGGCDRSGVCGERPALVLSLGRSGPG